MPFLKSYISTQTFSFCTKLSTKLHNKKKWNNYLNFKGFERVYTTMKVVCGSKREDIGLMVSKILPSPGILTEFPRVIFKKIIPSHFIRLSIFWFVCYNAKTAIISVSFSSSC